jgi:hypothetical protein
MIAETKKTSTRPAPPGAPGKPTGAAPSSIGVLDRNVSPDDASWAELYLGDEIADRATVDISRLQQLVISVLLAVIFITLQWAALVKSDAKLGLQMPSFDDNSSFLWLLGLSHAAYIAYKAPTKTA